MCGFYGENFNHRRGEIPSLKKLLTLRGGDEFNTIEEGKLFLAHSRLSITGTCHPSSQPIYSSCNNFIFLFNGEIYSIWGQEESIIQDFGDTIAVLKAIEEFGVEDALLRLNGMFSCAVIDLKQSKLYLSTDYFGQKPLYLSTDSDLNIAFGSTGRLLIKDVDLNINLLNKRAINDFLTFGFVLPQHTVYKGIERLMPGSLFKVNLNDGTVYRNYEFQNQNYYLKNDLKEDFSSLLNKVMKDHLYSDFPVSIALSGGVDSTLIYGYLKEKYKDISPFTMSDHEVKEVENTEKATQFFCTETKKVPVAKDLAYSKLRIIFSALDEPISDSAILSSFFIFEQAKKSSKVILLGDGGDELFQGYNRHALWNKLTKNFFRFSMVLAAKILWLLTKILWLLTKKFGLKIPQKLTILNNALKNMESQVLFTLSALSIDKFDSSLYKDLSLDSSFINEVDQKLYLPGNNLYRIDRISLLNNVEARAPLLDLRIANFSRTLDFNKGFNQSKSILKKMRDEVYDGVNFSKKKMGFNVDVTSIVKSNEAKKHLERGCSLARDFGFNFDINNVSERRKFNLICFSIWAKENFNLY